MDRQGSVNRTQYRRPAILWLALLMLASAPLLTRDTLQAAAQPKLPVIELDPSVELSPDAALTNVDAAISYTQEIVVGKLHAKQPGVARVQLHARPGSTPVWRVTFDSARFAVPSCPPPDPQAPQQETGEFPCCYGERATIAVTANTGMLVELAIPAPIHGP